MKELKFLITCKWCNPEFGGINTDIYEYELAAFIPMERKYRELSKNDSYFQHTNITIVHKEKKS